MPRFTIQKIEAIMGHDYLGLWNSRSFPKKSSTKKKTIAISEPYKSKSQMRWAFATKQPWAARWAKHTPNMKNLPNKVKKRKH
jgi:hypothetical protein